MTIENRIRFKDQGDGIKLPGSICYGSKFDCYYRITVWSASISDPPLLGSFHSRWEKSRLKAHETLCVSINLVIFYVTLFCTQISRFTPFFNALASLRRRGNCKENIKGNLFRHSFWWPSGKSLALNEVLRICLRAVTFIVNPHKSSRQSSVLRSQTPFNIHTAALGSLEFLFRRNSNSTWHFNGKGEI